MDLAKIVIGVGKQVERLGLSMCEIYLFLSLSSPPSRCLFILIYLAHIHHLLSILFFYRFHISSTLNFDQK